MRGWEVLRFIESNGNPVGKIIRFMTNIEYRFPVYKSVGLTLFTDGGLLTDRTRNISHELIKWDSGFGLTVQTPIGRARLDFAFPMYQPESPQIQLGVQNLF